MKVIANTCVWSLALRRDKITHSAPIMELRNLILDHRIQMLGPIRQEILSGIRANSQFQKVKKHLTGFPDFTLISEDYETAASYFNLCRWPGIQGSNTDFLICAAAIRGKFKIFTVDNDFIRFAQYIPISFYEYSPKDSL